MKPDEALSAFLALSEEHRSAFLERLIISLTSYARQYYSGRSATDATSLSAVNELLHSIGGYLVQYRRNPSSVNAQLIFQTLDEKAKNDLKLKNRIVETLAAYHPLENAVG